MKACVARTSSVPEICTSRKGQQQQQQQQHNTTEHTHTHVQRMQSRQSTIAYIHHTYMDARASIHTSIHSSIHPSIHRYRSHTYIHPYTSMHPSLRDIAHPCDGSHTHPSPALSLLWFHAACCMLHAPHVRVTYQHVSVCR